MVLVLKQETTLPIDIEYEQYDAQEVELLHVWVGTGDKRVDILPALHPDDVAEWEHCCLEDIEERKAEEAASRAEYDMEGWRR